MADVTKRDRVWAAILRVAKNGDQFQVGDVAGEVPDVSRRTVERTLRAAAEVGVVDHARGSPWYSAGSLSTSAPNTDDDQKGEDTADESASITPEAEADDDRERGARVEADGDQETSDGVDGVDVEAVLDATDLPGSGEKLERRHAAVRACYDLLRSEGEVQTATFKADVYADHPAGYQSARSWWKNCVYSGLLELADADDRVRVADTSGTWRWVD